MEGRGALRRTDAAWSVAVIVGFLVAWPALGQGIASAATVPTASVVGAQTQFDSTANKTIAAECPSGKRVIGGGGRVNGAQHVVLTQMEPVQSSSGDRYVVSASEDQTGFAGTWSLAAYAICADPPPGLEIVSATSALGSDAFQLVNVRCPGTKLAIGAGGRIDFGQGQVDLGTQARGTTIPTGTTVSGAEDLDGFSGNWSVTGFAICVTPVSVLDLQIVKVQTASDSTGRKFATAACPSGKRVTGGGAVASLPGVIESVSPDANRLRISVITRADSSTTSNWNMMAVAFCAS